MIGRPDEEVPESVISSPSYECHSGNVGTLMLCAGAVTSNDLVTVADAYGVPPESPPAWLAVIVHVPGPIRSTVPLVVTVQTNGVDEVYDNVKPEFVVALKL